MPYSILSYFNPSAPGITWIGIDANRTDTIDRHSKIDAFSDHSMFFRLFYNLSILVRFYSRENVP
ncbi:hypothetical protein CPB84DRAFT_1772592 [Gymnopilus junonius]|uniref:Uncharacterized protein n=1 Tax=Gymnopilus junonius TaxID=109634 RepID=A0A9P5TQY1_GYMJU|nr:hypothetical protein CPB84DRAFT_1772592 [Gymnopilus junonius]